eukprot:5882539-Pyramimonas_sp.AAC.1
MVEDCSYGLDSDATGKYVELCLAAEMSKVVLSEQQHMMLNVDHVTSMRVCHRRCEASCGRQGRHLLAKADVQANPENVSNAIYTEPKA